MPSPKSLLKLPHFSSPKTLRLIDYYKGLSDKNKGRKIVWADISWNEFTAHYLATHEALGQSIASLSYRRAQDEVRDSFFPPFRTALLRLPSPNPQREENRSLPPATPHLSIPSNPQANDDDDDDNHNNNNPKSTPPTPKMR